jgi:transcriptional regulator with GAF, ATPase, and Fis domain
MPLGDERTEKLAQEGAESADAGTGNYSLLVATDRRVFSYAMPTSGAVCLGRSPTCDLPVEDDSVSRRHVIFHCAGRLEVEDLGATNGTRLAGHRFSPGERVPLRIGSVIELGRVVVIVQRGGSGTIVADEGAAPRGSSDLPLLEDPTMKQLYRLLDVVAPTLMSVLILGETGVGKELFAATLHKRSPRAERPFLKLNCAALPESIIESELFGHERGAFTGAMQTKIGLFESAEGGTVFLDEVGELPLGTQAKLLRVLESGEVMRVGSVKTKKIDFRLVSATNRDLQSRTTEGQFRADLFFRLNGFTITIPPLRERKQDVLALGAFFLAEARQKLALGKASFSPEAVRAMQDYAWPGNIRELRNVLDRAALLCVGGTVEPADLNLPLASAQVPSRPSAIPRGLGPHSSPPSASDPDTTKEFEVVQPQTDGGGLRSAMGALEKQRILAALEQCGGNQSRAAKMLGIARRTLVARLDAYGVIRPRKNS